MDVKDDKTDLLTDILSSNQEILKMADTKSNYIIGISGIILSIIAPMDKTGFSPYKLFFLKFAVIFLIFSTISQFMTIFPRVNETNPKNILFYKGILQHNRREYEKNIREMTTGKIIKDFTDSVYYLAKIQKTKYIYLKIGLLSLIISIILISLSFFF